MESKEPDHDPIDDLIGGLSDIAEKDVPAPSTSKRIEKKESDSDRFSEYLTNFSLFYGIIHVRIRTACELSRLPRKVSCACSIKDAEDGMRLQSLAG